MIITDSTKNPFTEIFAAAVKNAMTDNQFTEIINAAVKNAMSEAVIPTTPKYYNPIQLAEVIGWKLSTVYQNHHHGLIPGARKVGNRLLFDSEIILAWITENSIPTRAEKVKRYEGMAK